MRMLIVFDALALVSSTDSSARHCLIRAAAAAASRKSHACYVPALTWHVAIIYLFIFGVSKLDSHSHPLSLMVKRPADLNITGS